MSILIADLIRGFVTNIMFMVVLLSVVEPKFSKKWTWVLVAVIALANNALSGYFYVKGDYTIITKINVILLAVVSVCAKPLFKESFMQWLFNIFTVINFYATIIILSYLLSRFFFYPQYAVTLIRLIMFIGVYYLFSHSLKPLYRKAIEHWKVYFLLCFGIFINLAYYLYFSEDVKLTMQENVIPLLLIILLQVFAYVSIFYSLRNSAIEFSLKEENLKNIAQQKLLQTELNAYEDFIAISKQNLHDLRHHNAVLAQYLDEGNTKGARDYLKLYDENLNSGAPKEFCKNKVANAIFRLYERRTKDADISFAINADLPEQTPLSAPEIGIVLSNLLENAFEACEFVEDKKIGFISTIEDNTLHIEVRNNIKNAVQFLGDYPISTKENGGIGTKSVATIIKKYGGMLRFAQTDKEYLAQIILPL